MVCTTLSNLLSFRSSRKVKEATLGQSRSLFNGHQFSEKMNDIKLESVYEETVTSEYALVINGHSLVRAAIIYNKK